VEEDAMDETYWEANSDFATFGKSNFDSLLNLELTHVVASTHNFVTTFLVTLYVVPHQQSILPFLRKKMTNPS
jgi:hypothetical protein